MILRSSAGLVSPVAVLGANGFAGAAVVVFPKRLAVPVVGALLLPKSPCVDVASVLPCSILGTAGIGTSGVAAFVGAVGLVAVVVPKMLVLASVAGLGAPNMLAVSVLGAANIFAVSVF